MVGFNPRRFAVALIKTRAQRGVRQFLEKIGPERVDKLIRLDKPFAAIIPPEVMGRVQPLAKQWAWAADVISKEDFLKMLPPWVHETVAKHGDKGTQWLDQQVTWLQEVFK